MPLTLYSHPASTTSRAVMLFIAEAGIDVALRTVDLFTGEHLGDAYTGLNPNALVPMLEDGDFRLSESSAILKYLADLADSPAYPRELKARARVNERMDWFNTQLTRDFAYGFIYPQIFDAHRRPHPATQEQVLEWHRQRAARWLAILDKHVLGANAYVCGAAISIADYQGAVIVALGDVAHLDYSAYPNVQRWLASMKKLPSWKQVHTAIDGYAASIAGGRFTGLTAATGAA